MTDEELRALPKVNCATAAKYLGMNTNKLRGAIVDGKIPIGIGERGATGRRWIWINVEALIKYKHGEVDGAAAIMYSALANKVTGLERMRTT